MLTHEKPVLALLLPLSLTPYTTFPRMKGEYIKENWYYKKHMYSWCVSSRQIRLGQTAGAASRLKGRVNQRLGPAWCAPLSGPVMCVAHALM